MRLISWNVNGIRSVLKKGFLEFVADARPDILCLQETRARPEQVDLSLSGYRAFWNPAERPGYAGTAVFTRIEPRSVECGLGASEHDAEGRIITMAFDDFTLVNVYTPNAQRGLKRLDYRTQQWDPAFLEHIQRLATEGPVIFCGDLNVAHREIDLARPAANHMNAGFTDAERAGFDRIVQAGFLDTFRLFHTDGGHYTWWSYMAQARARNVGWRIDYVGISPDLRPRLKSATILSHVTGSDHCPVAIELT